MGKGTVNVPPKRKITASEISDFAEKVAAQVAESEPKSHSHTASEISGLAEAVAAQVAAAEPKAHTHAASAITAGTFAGAVVAYNDTAYTTYKVRNAAIVSATPTSMANGTFALVYS